MTWTVCTDVGIVAAARAAGVAKVAKVDAPPVAEITHDPEPATHGDGEIVAPDPAVIEGDGGVFGTSEPEFGGPCANARDAKIKATNAM